MKGISGAPTFTPPWAPPRRKVVSLRNRGKTAASLGCRVTLRGTGSHFEHPRAAHLTSHDGSVPSGLRRRYWRREPPMFLAGISLGAKTRPGVVLTQTGSRGWFAQNRPQ